MDPDLELLQLWRDGDKNAGGRLLAKYFADLHAYFKSRLPNGDQEDLIQEVFTRMIAGLERFEGRSSVKTYLFGIAQNVFYEALRRRYRPTGTFDPISESVADASGRTQSSILALDEELQLLLDALCTIPSQQQELLELHYFHELSYVELSAMLELPVGTVRSRAFAARRTLLNRYAELLGAAADDSRVERDLKAARASIFRAQSR